MGPEASSVGVRASFRKVACTLATRTVHLPSGAFLFRQNDVCDGLYILQAGEVELLLESPLRARALRHLRPKSIIGLPECLHGANRRSSARVVLPSTLRFVPLDALMAALQREPALCLKAAALISEEINSSVSLLRQLHCSRTGLKANKVRRM